ncbi:MAG: hypothetical protein K2M97_01065, partial [Muribaculaceae bacterium]|nr:hypothetical protein [Muribaculaceae bacterium]
MRFSTDSTLTLSMRTPARTLSGTYTHWSGPIADSDALRLTSDLIETYISIAEQARTAARYIQPVMVWWRLLDTDGRTIHRSTPVILGPDGLQACDPLTATVTRQSDRWEKLAGFTMSLRAFSPVVTVSPSQWSGCKIEILVTPPVDVIAADSSRTATATYAFGPASTSEATLTATMRHTDPTAMIAAMLDRIESISVVAASIGADSDTPATVTLRPTRLLDTNAESASLIRTLHSAVSPRDQLIDLCCAPHTFTAHAALVDSDTVVWGDITPILAPPPLPSDIAVGWRDNTQWSQTSVISSTDTPLCSATSSGNGKSPASLSPLICYPLSSAHTVDMQLSSTLTSGRRTCSIPLSATPASRWAFAILSPLLQPVNPIEWPVGSPLQTVATATLPHRPSAILIAKTSDPFNPVKSVTLSRGTVHAITPASRTNSAWDFARRHFYIFSSTDIHSLSISRTTATSSLSTLLPVGISSGSKVTVTPHGVFAIGNDGVIRCVRGSTASHFTSPVTPPLAIAWSSATSELWAIDDSLLPITVYPEAGQQCYRRSDIRPDRIFCVGPHILIALQGTLY